MKLLCLIILVLGVGAKGYFLPSGPSPVRGHSQGRFWGGHEKSDDENKYLYQQQHGYQQYSDYRGYYQHPAAQAIPNQQLLPEQQYIYQQEAPFQQLVPQQLVPQQVVPQHVLLPETYQQQILPYQYLTRTPGSTLPLTAQTTIPLVVKLADNQALVVPVRAVYALPPFLERLVQRVQSYYSVYNPVEDLTLDRPLYSPTETTLGPSQVENATSTPDKKITTESSETTTKDPKVSTLSVVEINTTIAPSTEGENQNSTEEETTAQIETTTDPANYISPDAAPSDLEGEGYSYQKPSRSFRFRK